MTKKYQVFISSTYVDLVDERKAVEETIIRAGDIPVGMEAFPAADDEQFSFIKTVIDACDYYVLIIAARYGSVADDGLSYTEKEYRYAVEKGIPVLVFSHDNPGSISNANSEASTEGKTKLNAFISLASDKRVRKGWSSTDGLKLAVREALDHAKATKPRPGWVRGDTSSDTELLRENRDLRAQLAELSSLAAAAPNAKVEFEVAGLDTAYDLAGTHLVLKSGANRATTATWRSSITLKEAFEQLAPNMRGNLIHSQMNNLLAIAAQRVPQSDLKRLNSFAVNTADFNAVIIQLEALGLVVTDREKTNANKNATYSRLSDAGLQLMYKLLVREA